MNIPEITFPNEDEDFIKNPYPYLKELRNSSPIHYDKPVSYTHLTLPTMDSV